MLFHMPTLPSLRESTSQHKSLDSWLINAISKYRSVGIRILDSR